MLYESHSFVIMSKGVSVFDLMKRNLTTMALNKKITIDRTVRLGIDDLKSEYAFQGSSQGDETLTNDVEEYNRQDGWLITTSRFEGIELTQQAVDNRVKEIKQENKDYIKELKNKREYGKEVDGSVTFEMESHSYWDNTEPYPVESKRFTILNFE